MILEFKKEDFKKGCEKIVIRIPRKVFLKSLPNVIEVRSPFTGVVKSFVLSESKSEEYGMANEFWDGEEGHLIYVDKANPNAPYVIDVCCVVGE